MPKIAVVKKTASFFINLGLVLLPTAILAANNFNNAGNILDTVAGSNGAGLPDKKVTEIVSTVIFALFSIVGVIFLVLMIYGGYTWMMARGDEAYAQKAKDTIRHSVIGMIVIVAAYAITKFIASYLLGQ